MISIGQSTPAAILISVLGGGGNVFFDVILNGYSTRSEGGEGMTKMNERKNSKKKIFLKKTGRRSTQ
jgi:hypothetical protein